MQGRFKLDSSAGSIKRGLRGGEWSIAEYGDSHVRDYESRNQGRVRDGREEEADWVGIKKESQGMHS